MRFRRRKQEADARARASEREVEISRERLRETHERVVRPLTAAGKRNQFADMIRASFEGGRR